MRAFQLKESANSNTIFKIEDSPTQWTIKTDFCNLFVILLMFFISEFDVNNNVSQLFKSMWVLDLSVDEKIQEKCVIRISS
jgi:hypothetical protein